MNTTKTSGYAIGFAYAAAASAIPAAIGRPRSAAAVKSSRQTTSSVSGITFIDQVIIVGSSAATHAQTTASRSSSTLRAM
jgi:hypothetical protein